MAKTRIAPWDYKQGLSRNLPKVPCPVCGFPEAQFVWKLDKDPIPDYWYFCVKCNKVNIDPRSPNELFSAMSRNDDVIAAINEDISRAEIEEVLWGVGDMAEQDERAMQDKKEDLRSQLLGL